MDIQKLTEGLTIGETLAYGYAGSRLYGLNTDTSDIDISIIADKKGRDKQFIRGEIDLRIHPIDLLTKRLWTAELPETDLIFSRSLTFTNDRYETMLYSFRPNSYHYFSNSEAMAIKFMPKITPEIAENRREYKSLKASIRALMLAWKMLDQGDEFMPIFTERERDTYWRLMEDFQKRAQNGQDWETMMTAIHHEARKLRNM
jgi:hypothetical protein